jgi:hypothetical protein
MMLLPYRAKGKSLMGFAKFMAGPIGRGVRALVGAVLIVLGLFTSMAQPLGTIVAVVGVVFVLVGVFNVCLIAPIIGAPFSGKDALAK